MNSTFSITTTTLNYCWHGLTFEPDLIKFSYLCSSWQEVHMGWITVCIGQLKLTSSKLVTISHELPSHTILARIGCSHLCLFFIVTITSLVIKNTRGMWVVNRMCITLLDVLLKSRKHGLCFHTIIHQFIATRHIVSVSWKSEEPTSVTQNGLYFCKINKNKGKYTFLIKN